MARNQIYAVVQTADPDTQEVTVVPGASVLIQNTSDLSAATVYAAATGGTTLSNPVTADSAGRVPGWLDDGDYTLTATSGELTWTQEIKLGSDVSPTVVYIVGAFLGRINYGGGGFNVYPDPLLFAQAESPLAWGGGAEYIIATAEKSTLFMHLGSFGATSLPQAGDTIAFSMLAQDPVPDNFSIGLTAYTLDGSNILSGHWDSSSDGGGGDSAYWVDVSTGGSNNIYGLGAGGPNGGNDSLHLYGLKSTSVFGEDSHIVWAEYGSDLSFVTPGSRGDTGLISVVNDLTAPLLVTLTCRGFWSP